METPSSYLEVTAIIRTLIIFLLGVLFIVSAPALSQARWSLTPRLAIQGQTDDNIFLDENDEVSDFITTISPGINLTQDHPSQEIGLDYNFQHSFFRDNSDFDFSGHRALVEARKEFGSPLEVGIREFFIRSDDPIELPGINLFERPSIRDGRRTLYTRNVVEPLLVFRIGEERLIDLRYRNHFMQNDMDDIAEVNPDFSELEQNSVSVRPAFRFDAHNGLELYYQYLDQDYILAPLPEDYAYPIDLRPNRDVAGNEIQGTYTHYFNPIFATFLQYRFYQRSYEKSRFYPLVPEFPDYAVHDPRIGVTHDFHETASLTASAGYACRTTSGQKDQQTFAGRIALSGQYKVLNYDLFGATGFDEDFLSDEALGFYEFWRGGVNGRIEQLESFSAEVFFYIEKDDFYDVNRKDTIWNFRTSLSYEVLRWLSLGVDYIFFKRDSNETDRSYTDNRFFFRLTAAYDVVEHMQ